MKPARRTQKAMNTTKQAGDASALSAAPAWRRRMTRVAGWLYPSLLLLIMLALWELLVRAAGIQRFILPAPSEVIRVTFNSYSLLLANTPPTAFAVIVGFFLAALIAIPLAVAMCAWRGVEQSVYPLLIGSQGVPKVALAPVLIVWFGFGFAPKVFMAALIAFIPIVINTTVGLRSIDPNYVHLVRSMGASRWQIYTRLLLPSALPQILAGLNVAMALAIVGAVVGEMVGANSGLGYLLVVANGDLNMPFVFAVLLWLAFVSLILVGAVDLVERIAIPWSKNSRTRAVAQAD
jgi:NitT/TauT family transport system permease protein